MKRTMTSILGGLLAAVLLISPALAASPFPDVDENAPYAAAVEAMKDFGIMVGSKGNFNPTNPVSRAEMATIVCRMRGENEAELPTGDAFEDVPDWFWGNKCIVRAAALGIVNGDGHGHFLPYTTVTYEQAVTMIVRALGREEAARAAGGYPNGHLYVAETMHLLEGLSSQVGEPMTRADIAMLVYNYFMHNE